MAGTAPMEKLEDDVLRKFYRSFHKHGAANLAKVAKETKLLVEQCEMLHKQHMSFLSLAPSASLETAFLALVNDHYNATQKRISEELQEDDSARGSKPARRGTGEPDEAEANVTANSSQKPKRTPKPTPQRLAAEEELQARRQARSNQSTPKSAKSKMAAKAPPSPPNGEWNSSQRKRSRRLFEDTSELDVPRYRSPLNDRWRGRLISDVDEGVDALLSLASGAHASSNLDEHHSGPDIATTTADPVDGDEVHKAPQLQGTPKRARGGRGVRATPTPTGTPLKGAARGAAAAITTAGSDGLPMPSSTGLRSPRGRSGATSGAATAGATSGRGQSVSGSGRQRKERGSPARSVEPEDEANGEPMSEAGDVGPTGTGAPSPGPKATAAGTDSAIGSGPSASPGLVSPSGRPVRKRKPTAIALAAAAAAEEEEGLSGRNVRGVVAAVAAAVAATAADSMGSVPLPESIFGSDEGGGDGAVGDLLPSAPHAQTRSSARIAQVGPSSRRTGERLSPMDSTPPAADGAGTTAEDEAGRDGEQGADRGMLSASVAGSLQAAEPTAMTGTAAGRAQGVAAVGPGGVLLQGSLPGSRQGAGRPPMQPLPGRARRRKSLPERIPPLWDSLKHQAKGRGGNAVAAAATAPAAAGGGVAADGAPGPAPSALRGDAGAIMLAAELALRHCLGNTRLRRWCMYEFFYSALDRPWFVRNELMEFCLHMQLPTTKLTRMEWSFLRSALGRPRRLSLAFLREERLRLEGYRAHARMKYEEVTSSIDVAGLEVPAELPRQLRVGQEVTARHYISRQLHDGVILTVKGNKYRVQFHRGDLMTEVIRDTEVMPLDPHECMPLNIPIMPTLLNGRSYDAVRLAGLRGLLPNLAMRSLGVGIRPLGSWTTGLDTQLMRDQDAMMVAEVQRALEMKEMLVARLTQLNNEAQSGLHTDEMGGRTEHFQLQYTTVVLQLKETNAVLEGALNRLQGRQQQVMNAANNPYGAILALQQQQQQPQHGAAMSVTLVAANGVSGAAGLAARMTAGPQASSVPHGAPQVQPPALSNPQGQATTPPAPQQQVASGSPTIAETNAAASAPHQARSGPAKPPGQVSSQPPLSPSAPLVVPPLRSNAPTAPAAAASQPYSLTQQPLQLSMLLPTVSSEQLVVQALAEARNVVEVCRGKGAEPTLSRGGVLPPPQLPAQPVPLVAPMLTMQAPGGAAVPLILPPGAVLPQQPQLLLQQSAMASTENMHQDQQAQPSVAALALRLPLSNGVARSDGLNGSCMMDGVAFPTIVEQQVPAELMAPASQGQAPCIKREEGTVEAGRQGVEGPVPGVVVEREPPEARGAAERPPTEEELAESWLREVIVGCVGVLFTIQKCTAGNVPADTVAEALDLAVQQVQLKSEGENEALYRDIVHSVQGLKDNLTRALA